MSVLASVQRMRAAQAAQMWRCENCNTEWDISKPGAVDTWLCSEEDCIKFTCEATGCRKKCVPCDRDFCDAHLTSKDYGDGLELMCGTCIGECEKYLEKCTGCGQPRCDIEDAEDRDDSTGYHATERLCGICRSGGKILQELTQPNEGEREGINGNAGHDCAGTVREIPCARRRRSGVLNDSYVCNPLRQMRRAV
jgi:hypothetical protein